MDKISNKVNSLFKYGYQSAPETANIYDLVNKLTNNKWVDKSESLDIIKSYIFHNEEQMQKFMKISVFAYVNAEAIRKMLDYYENTEKLDKEIARIESELKESGKL